MIEDILPSEVASAEVIGPSHDVALLPAEAMLVQNARPRRRAEFARGRECAHRALRELRLDAGPILRGERRDPLWPDGCVGSMTHCAEYVGAAVGRSDRFQAIAIDAEPDAPLPDGVLNRVSLPSERAQLARREGPNLDRLLFCAKEAVYKAWYPLTHRWLGFHQAEIQLAWDTTFRARLLVAGPVEQFNGRWLARDGLLMTAIATRRPDPRPDTLS